MYTPLILNFLIQATIFLAFSNSYGGVITVNVGGKNYQKYVVPNNPPKRNHMALGQEMVFYSKTAGTVFYNPQHPTTEFNKPYNTQSEFAWIGDGANNGIKSQRFTKVLKK